VEVLDLTTRFRDAGAQLEQLRVFELAGVVIIRGRANDRTQAEAVSRIATTLGYDRVANLVQVTPQNDAQLVRDTERELSMHRALDGCKFNVSAERGVVRVGGLVEHELQKDVVVQVVRSIDGVRSVDVSLLRF
jgi:osmotically-inducible protein OsmY